MKITIGRLVLITVLLVGVGFAIMMAGLLYDILYAGIPYQDAPPALAADYNEAKRVANGLFMGGACVGSIGALVAIWAAVKMILRLWRT